MSTKHAVVKFLLMASIFVIGMIIPSKAQEIHLQDLNNNNGYVTLNLENVKIIRNYNKVLHIINVTEIEATKDHIKENILGLRPKSELIGPMYSTLNQSLIILEAKIKNLIPHFRQNRGLIDILGTGLKYIAGTMDHSDEIEIKEKLDQLFNYNGKLIKENNKQVLINKEISEQIQNITTHIKNQQRSIEQYLNTYNLNFKEKMTTLEDEIKLMQYVYHIHNDVLLLRNHVDDIEQILFSSRLGLLSKNILTKKELDLIPDIENYKGIKVTVASYKEQIVIVLLIPQFSDQTYSQVIIEPIPDKNQKSLYLDQYEILVDGYNKAFEFPVKENLKKNLVSIKNECINDIIKSKETVCKKQLLNHEQVKEITEGIVITKNLNNVNLVHNCNKLNITLKGNYLIKFKNCKIELKNETFQNFETRIFDKIILPNFVTKIKEEKVIETVKLEELYLKHIKNRELIEDIAFKSTKFTTATISFNTLIILSIVIFIIIFKFNICKKRKKVNRTNVKIISAEPQSNGGGVIVEPHVHDTKPCILKTVPITSQNPDNSK